MKNELIPFIPEHIDLMELRDEKHMKNYKDKIANYATMGLAYTLVVDDEIVCCAGIVSPHAGIAEAWLVAGKNFDKHGTVISRTIKNFLKWTQPFYHRYQMSVLEGFEDAERFAEFLGFEKEGLMRKFDSEGNNYFMYARVV